MSGEHNIDEAMDPGEMNALEIQQQYFENLLGCDWVKYEKVNHRLLLKNIAFALFGAPASEENATEHEELTGYSRMQANVVLNIYKKIHEQKKYSLNNEDIAMAVLLVVCCKPKSLGTGVPQPRDAWVGLETRRTVEIDVWCTAVFRIRKCLPVDRGTTGCCLYIDVNARVYQSWESYTQNNTLPKCVYVVPERGSYAGTVIKEENLLAVKLSVLQSPAFGPKACVLNGVDKTSTVASLGAMGVLGASMFTPVAPVVLAGAVVATVTTSLYTALRSGLSLQDRKNHEQPIGVDNSEARCCYFNIAAASVGIAASASTRLLARAAANGTNATMTGQFIETTVEVLRYSNLIAGTGGLVNSFAHLIIKYKRGEAPSSLEVVQFTASTLFFANAVMSNRTARSIIEEAQMSTINDYRAILSRVQRKLFDQARAIVGSTDGNIQGNTAIIRGIKHIENKHEYFSDIIRAGGADGRNLSLPIGSDGAVILDGMYDQSGSGLLQFSGASQICKNLLSSSDFVNINPGEILRIGQMLYRITTGGIQEIAELLEKLSEWAHNAMIVVCCNLLDTMCPVFLRELRKIYPDGDLIATVVNFVFRYISDLCDSRDDVGKENEFVELLRGFFRDGRVKKEKIIQMYSAFRDRCSRVRYENSQKTEVLCNKCNGIYFE